MEPELQAEVDAALQLAARKSQLIERLLAEQSIIAEKLAGLGYQPPKRTRKPRATAPEGSSPEPKRKRTGKNA